MSFLKRLFGPPNVEELKAKHNIKGLIKALGYQKESSVRQAASGALVEIGTSVIEPLLTALKDEKVCEIVAETLDKLGWQADRSEAGAYYWIAKGHWDQCVEIGAPATEPLISALKKDENRDAAAAALVQIGASSVESLVAAIGDEGLRDAALTALIQIGSPSVKLLLNTAATGFWEDQRQATSEAIVKIGIEAVDPLITALQDENRDVREVAAKLLGQIEDGRAVVPLGAALKDQDVGVGAAAIKALGQIGVPAIGSLVDALNDNGLSRHIHGDAAEVLGEIGDVQAVEPLIDALNDKNKDVLIRRNVAESLGKIGDVRAIESLTVALNDHKSDKNYSVSWNAVKALGQIGDAQAVTTLISALKDEALQGKAFEALAYVGILAIEPLLEALEDNEDKVRVGAMMALGGIGVPAADPLVAFFRRNKDFDVNRAAAALLPKIDTSEVKMGIGAITGERWFYRKYETAYKTSMTRPSYSVYRYLSAKSLANVIPPEWAALIAVLKKEDESVRQAAERALKKFGWAG